MPDRVLFRSAAFPKYPDEDAETVNEHCWGKRLAEWLRDGLPAHGVKTGEILCEDWGWLVPVEHGGDFPVWVGCGVVEDEDDEASATGESEFTAFVAAEPGFFKRLFKKVDTTSGTEPVLTALRAMVDSSPDIREVRWED